MCCLGTCALLYSCVLSSFKSFNYFSRYFHFHYYVQNSSLCHSCYTFISNCSEIIDVNVVGFLCDSMSLYKMKEIDLKPIQRTVKTYKLTNGES